MRRYTDVNGNQVTLTFSMDCFPIRAKHVLVITRYKEDWLLTDHPIRGLEFPGGKIETGESAEDAAKREVYEETGGVIRSLDYVGEYLVEEQDHSAMFVKAIYFADVEKLEKRNHYLETNGPVLKGDELLEELHHPEYSFIIKDQTVPLALREIFRMSKK